MRVFINVVVAGCIGSAVRAKKHNPESMYLNLGCNVISIEAGAALKVGGAVGKVQSEAGFGNSLNKYAWSSVVDPTTGDLYIGTFNVNFNYIAVPEYVKQIQNSESSFAGTDAFLRLWSGSPITYSSGGEIFRLKGTEWMRVFKAPKGHVGFRHMVAFQGRLYAASANGVNGPGRDTSNYDIDVLYSSKSLESSGARIFRTNANGVWGLMPKGGPTLDREQRSIRALFASTSGVLYVGTEGGPPSSRSQLWSYKETKKGNLRPVGVWKLLFDSTITVAVSEIYEFAPGIILFGTWGPKGYDLRAFEEGSDITFSIRPPNEQIDPTGLNGIMEIRKFKSALYVGLLSYTNDGFTLCKSLSSFEEMKSGTAKWTYVTQTGFKNEQLVQLGAWTGKNLYPWSGRVIDNTYYIGTFTSENPSGSDLLSKADGRAQLWATQDGETWTNLNADAFGQVGTYGFRTMQEYNGELTIGTASNMFIPTLSKPPYAEFLKNMSKEMKANLISAEPLLISFNEATSELNLDMDVLAGLTLPNPNLDSEQMAKALENIEAVTIEMTNSK